jgi:SAM-dependent methyltransferase
LRDTLSEMSTEASGSGYLTDVAYVRQFRAELNPAGLRAITALAGCRPPDGDDFTYCEIGAGFGDTLATLSAAYPRARFVGVDVNPAHVAAARNLATRGALDNVRFIEGDFEELNGDDLPAFDYVCAHGLLSWVAPSKQRALFARAARWLKPGGLLYLGYNALPGWASVAPLRRFMLDAASSVEGSSEARVRHALAAARLLRDANATYFVDNPSAKLILTTMLEMGVPYTAHEFFNPHWHPAYFADVAREVAEHDLRFVGQFPLHLNYRDLAQAPALAGAMASTTDRRAWEHVRAFASNEFFRRDIYVKGAVPGAEDTGRAYLDATRFGTLVGIEQVKREVALPARVLRFAGAPFDAVIEVLAGRTSTVAELAAVPSLAPLGVDVVRQAVLLLAMGSDVVPMVGASRPAGANASRYRVPSAFNRVVLDQALSRTVPTVLASPVAGTGVSVSMLHAVALRALTEADVNSRAAWIHAFVEATPLRLYDHGRELDDKDDLARALGLQIQMFCATRLPKLIELGILEPEP